MLIFVEVFCNNLGNQRCLDTTRHSVINRMMFVLQSWIVQRRLTVDN